MLFPNKAALAATLALALMPALGARAQSVKLADTFGPSQSFDARAGANVDGALDPFGPLQIAEPFTPLGGDYSLDRIDGAFSHVVARPNINAANSLILTLQTSDLNGLPSGNVLESFSLTGLPLFPNALTVATATSLLHPTLVGGQKYWVVASPGDPTAAMVWNSNPTDTDGVIATNHLGFWQSGKNPVGAFDLYGSRVAPVPEASTTVSFGLLLALGVGVVAFRRKRRA